MCAGVVLLVVHGSKQATREASVRTTWSLVGNVVTLRSTVCFVSSWRATFVFKCVCLAAVWWLSVCVYGEGMPPSTPMICTFHSAKRATAT